MNTGQRENAQGELRMGIQAPPPRANSKVCVLNVKWSSHDLGDSVDGKYDMVRETFEKMGFIVEDFLIRPSDDSERDLKRKLGTFFKSAGRSALYIVYYHGHGYVPVAKGPKNLVLFSHNKADVKDIRKFGKKIVQNRLSALGERLQSLDDLFDNTAINTLNDISAKLSSLQDQIEELSLQLKPRFKINFETIFKTILDAKGDVFVILDCCDAGAAANPIKPTDIITGEYNKHAIFACRQGSTANGDMTSALCKMLMDRREGFKDTLKDIDKALKVVDKASNDVKSAEEGLRTAEKEMKSAQLKSRQPRHGNHPQKTPEKVKKAKKAVEEAKKAAEKARRALGEAEKTVESMQKVISGTEIKEGLIKEFEEVEEVRIRSRISQSGVWIPLTLKSTHKVRRQRTNRRAGR